MQDSGTEGPGGHLSVNRDGFVLSDAVPRFAVQDITATDLQGCREHLGDSDLSPARGVALPSRGGRENPSEGQRFPSLPKVALVFSPSVPRG